MRTEKIRSGSLTLAFSGAQRRGELRNPAFWGIPNAKHRDKFRKGRLTYSFLRAKRRGELLCGPCVLRGPQRQAWVLNQKWLPHPYLLGGPKEAGIAT